MPYINDTLPSFSSVTVVYNGRSCEIDSCAVSLLETISSGLDNTFVVPQASLNCITGDNLAVFKSGPPKVNGATKLCVLNSDSDILRKSGFTNKFVLKSSGCVGVGNSIN